MSDPALALVMLSSFIFIILLGFPIAFTLMAMGVGFGFYAYYVPGQEFFDSRVFYLLSQNTFSIMNNDVLTAVPRPQRINRTNARGRLGQPLYSLAEFIGVRLRHRAISRSSGSRARRSIIRQLGLRELRRSFCGLRRRFRRGH